MDRTAITSDRVRECLRAIRFGKPLENGPLFELAAVRERLRRERVDPASEMAAWIVADVLRNVIDREWRRVRAEIEADIGNAEEDAWEALKADFSMGNLSLEAWGIVRYRYFGVDERKLREVAQQLAVSPRTLTRRLTRGHELLAETLVRQEDSGSSAAPAGSGLPNPETSFVGREQEIAELRSLVAQHRLVTLTGMGGIGKSRLTLHLARSIAPSYGDGVVFVDLSGVDRVEGVHTALQDALDAAESTGQSVLDAVAQHVGDRDLLVVVDNCEQVATTIGDAVTCLLNRCDRVQIVATSREPIGCPRETPYHVRGLAVPPEGAKIPVGRERLFDGVRLFEDRARRVGWDPDHSPSTAARITRLCRELDGIPLAIELAAARAAEWSLEMIETGIADRFKLLAGERGALRIQHATMRTVLDVSTRALDRSEARLLARLVVFRGGWTVEAVEAICTDDEIQPCDVVALMDRLKGRSLIEVDADRGPDDSTHRRYRMLRTVRAYVEEHLLAAAAVEHLRDRHLTYFTRVAEASSSGLRGAGQHHVLRALDADASNLRAAIAHALSANRVSDGLRLTGSLTLYWWMKGRWTSGRAVTEAMLARDTGRRASEERVLALGAAGNLAYVQGDLTEARSYLEEGLDICDRLALDDRRIGLLNGLANVFDALNDDGAAEAVYREALALAEESGELEAAVGIRENLASVLQDRGKIECAIPYLRQVLAHHERSGGPLDVAHVLHNLAVAEWYAGRFEDAEDHIRRALEMLREAEAAPLLADVLQVQANLASRRGDLVAAEAAMQESIELYGTIGGKKKRTLALNNQGSLRLRRGDMTGALASARECLEEATGGDPSPELVAFALRGMADVHIQNGDLDEATDCLRRGLEQHLSLDPQPSWDGRQLTSFAVLAMHTGDLESAGRLAGTAIDLIGEDRLPGQMRSEARIESVRERIATVLGNDAARSALSHDQPLTRDEAFQLAREVLGEEHIAGRAL